MIIPSLRYKKKARLEIIPLIDIVFFLLATFVMVSLSMVKNQGVSVNLPSASTGSRQIKDSDATTTITVTEKGEIFFNKDKVTAAELPRRLADLKKNTQDPALILNADKNALYGKTILVLDEARRVGIKKVSLETRQP